MKLWRIWYKDGAYSLGVYQAESAIAAYEAMTANCEERVETFSGYPFVPLIEDVEIVEISGGPCEGKEII